MGLDIFFIIKFKDGTEKILRYFKVNFLRKFIIDNTEMLYEDNCKEIEVSQELLQKLYDKTEEVLNLDDISAAEDILPTLGGFFFGSTDYDEHYLENVQKVHDDLDEILYGKDITGFMSEKYGIEGFVDVRMGVEIESIIYTEWW